MNAPSLPHGSSRPSARSTPATALTLVELVVVLMVVCIAAGMVAWVGTRVLRRSVVMASAAIASEVAAAVARHHARTGSWPDGFDSLIEAPYTLYAAIPAAARRQLKPKDLDNADRSVLKAHGITTTWMHAAPGGAGVSWQELTDRKALDVTAGGFLADDVAALDTRRINPDDLFGHGCTLGTPNESFVVLGIGSRCSLVGPSAELSHAPVLAAASMALDPATSYRRLALVLRIDRDDPRPVRWMGVVAFGESGIETVHAMVRAAARD